MGADNIFIINSCLLFLIELMTAINIFKAKRISKIEGCLQLFIGFATVVILAFSLYFHVFFTGQEESIFLNLDFFFFILSIIVFVISVVKVVKRIFHGGKEDV